MDLKIDKEKMDQVLGAIHDSLSKADTGVGSWSTSQPYEKEIVEYWVERAFIKTMVLLEAVGMSETLAAVRNLNERAKPNYARLAVGDEPYLAWASELEHYLSAIKDTLGGTGSGTITKELVQILRETQYAITDTKAFSEVPSGESQVHVRIEAILRCIFPDLRTKPPIAKPIKNFEPDTGIPSLNTLIEYKFIASSNDARRVADEVLADTRGYISREWTKFIYVIYETRRITPQQQWNELLKRCGADANTTVIVISGEPTSVRRKSRKRQVEKRSKGQL